MEDAFQRLVGVDLDGLFHSVASAAPASLPPPASSTQGALEKVAKAFEKAGEAAVRDALAIPDDGQRGTLLSVRFEALVRSFWSALAQRPAFDRLKPDAIVHGSQSLQSLRPLLDRVCAASAQARKALRHGGALMAAAWSALAPLGLSGPAEYLSIVHMQVFADHVLTKQWGVVGACREDNNSGGLGPQAVVARFGSKLMMVGWRAVSIENRLPKHGWGLCEVESQPVDKSALAQAFLYGNEEAFSWLVAEDTQALGAHANGESVIFYMFSHVLEPVPVPLAIPAPVPVTGSASGTSGTETPQPVPHAPSLEVPPAILAKRRELLRLMSDKLNAKNGVLSSFVEVDGRWPGEDGITRGGTLLDAAIKSRDLPTVKLVLASKGAEIRCTRKIEHQRTKDGGLVRFLRTPTLVTALEHPCYEVIELLVERGILDGWKDKYDDEALSMVAAALAKLAVSSCRVDSYAAGRGANCTYDEIPKHNPEAKRILGLLFAIGFAPVWAGDTNALLAALYSPLVPGARGVEEQREVIQLLRRFREAGADICWPAKSEADKDHEEEDDEEEGGNQAPFDPFDSLVSMAAGAGELEVLDFAMSMQAAESSGSSASASGSGSGSAGGASSSNASSPPNLSTPLFAALWMRQVKAAMQLLTRYGPQVKVCAPLRKAKEQPIYALLELCDLPSEEAATVLRELVKRDPGLLDIDCFKGNKKLEWSPFASCIKAKDDQCLEVLLTSGLVGAKELALQDTSDFQDGKPTAPAELAARGARWSCLELLLKHTGACDKLGCLGLATMLHYEKYDLAEEALKRDGCFRGWRERDNEVDFEHLADSLSLLAVSAYPRNPGYKGPTEGLMKPNNPQARRILDLVLSKGFNWAWGSGRGNSLLRLLYRNSKDGNTSMLSDKDTRDVLERYHRAGMDIKTALRKEDGANDDDGTFYSLAHVASTCGHYRVLEFAIEACGCHPDAFYYPATQAGRAVTCLTLALSYSHAALALQLLKKHNARACYPDKDASSQPITFILSYEGQEGAGEATRAREQEELLRALIERDRSFLDIPCFKEPSTDLHPLINCYNRLNRKTRCLELMLSSGLAGVEALARQTFKPSMLGEHKLPARNALDIGAMQGFFDVVELYVKHTAVTASATSLLVLLGHYKWQLAEALVERGSLAGWREKYEEQALGKLADILALFAASALGVHGEGRSSDSLPASEHLKARHAVELFLRKGFTWPLGAGGMNTVLTTIYYATSADVVNQRPIVEDNALALLKLYHEAGVPLATLAKEGASGPSDCATLAHSAAMLGHLKVLDYAIDVCGCPSDSMARFFGTSWCTPLTMALRTGKAKAALRLLMKYRARAGYPDRGPAEQPIAGVVQRFNNREASTRLLEALIERDRSFLDIPCYKTPLVEVSPVMTCIGLDKPYLLELLLTKDLPGVKELALRQTPVVEASSLVPIPMQPAQMAARGKQWDCLELLLKHTETRVTDSDSYGTVAETVIRATREPRPPPRGLVAIVLAKVKAEKAAGGGKDAGTGTGAATTTTEAEAAATASNASVSRASHSRGFEDPSYAPYTGATPVPLEAAATAAPVADASAATAKESGDKAAKKATKRAAAKRKKKASKSKAAGKGGKAGDGDGSDDDDDDDEDEEPFEEPDDNLVDSRYAPSVDAMFAAMGLGPGGAPLEPAGSGSAAGSDRAAGGTASKKGASE